MNKICVYTCITGDYDNLNEIKKPEKNIDYYCFTNNKNLKSKTWKIIQITNGGLDNCRLARKIKILGHPTINQYDIALWSDADVIWEKDISLFVKTYLEDAPLAIFRHHSRNTIYDEAVACLRLRKDSKEIIVKTLELYDKQGYPDQNGLCESTVYIKRPGDPTVIKTMEYWFDIVKDYSRRDQLSFNYVAWKTQLKFKYIDLNVWDNNWFSTTKHISPKETEVCHVYYGNPNQKFDFNKYYIYPYKQTGNTYKFTATIPVDTDEIEFNPTEIIGTVYKNLTIAPGPEQISTLDTFSHGQTNVFCTSHSTITAKGNFKSGEKLFFSIELEPIEDTGLYKLIEGQCIKNSQLLIENQRLSMENEFLNNSNKNLNTQLQAILNTPPRKIARKIKKLFHHRKTA